jgi:hypothetical protein
VDLKDDGGQHRSGGGTDQYALNLHNILHYLGILELVDRKHNKRIKWLKQKHQRTKKLKSNESTDHKLNERHVKEIMPNA